jgi:hypothetical protein
MKNIVIILLSAILLFSISAGLSLWLNTPAPTQKEQTKSARAEGNKRKEEPEEPAPAPEPAVAPTAAGPTEKTIQLHAVVEARARELDRREAELKKREQQMLLIVTEIRGEQKTLDELRQQINEEKKALQSLRTSIDHAMADLDDKKKAAQKAQTDLEKFRTPIEAEEGKNLRVLVEALEAMTPENGAKLIKQLADKGEMGTAVKVLAQLKGRNKAAIMDQITVTDPDFAGEIFHRILGLTSQKAADPGL